jgi:hypothetical protein
VTQPDLGFTVIAQLKFRSIGERGIAMDSSMLIRIVSGVLFVLVLVILIQRRRTRVK